MGGLPRNQHPRALGTALLAVSSLTGAQYFDFRLGIAGGLVAAHEAGIGSARRTCLKWSKFKMSSVDELTRLHDLFVRGAITGEEFAAMKAAVIAGQMAQSNPGTTVDQQPTRLVKSGKSITFVAIGIICIVWITIGLAMAAEGLSQYSLEKSRALGVGLVIGYVLPTSFFARFLMRNKRNVLIGFCVLVADAILLGAAALLFHINE